MAGVTLDISIRDEAVKNLLARIQKRFRDLTPAMKLIGAIVRTSIVRNFEKEGRPGKWAGHSDITEKRRGKGAKILQDKGFHGGLVASIHLKAYKDRVVAGTNKIYAAVHQFGAKKGSFGTVTAKIREHVRKLKSGKRSTVGAHTRKMKLPWGDIPARPFMMVQKEDWEEIRDALSDFLIMGRAR